MNRQQGGISIEDRGLSSNGLLLIAISSSTIVVSIAIAIAIARISTGLMWAAIIVAIGQAGHLLLVGVGRMAREILTGRANLALAEGEAKARLIAARRQLPPVM